MCASHKAVRRVCHLPLAPENAVRAMYAVVHWLPYARSEAIAAFVTLLEYGPCRKGHTTLTLTSQKN